MFFGSALFRILFSSFAMISLTTPSLAKAQKCSTGTEYQGPATNISEIDANGRTAGRPTAISHS